MYMDPKKITHYRVVIYERDLQWRQFLARELLGLGFESVDQANTASETLQLIRDHHVDALITLHDLKLIKFLRNNRLSPNRDIIIILLTANLGAKDIHSERDSGVNEIVAKPASISQVITHLYDALIHPRKFINVQRYHGPDRRRHTKSYNKTERRSTDQTEIKLL
jgi:two-component system, chemotaxis family, chemotaxis protein CheY